MAVPVFNDPENYHFELGKGIVLREGKDVTVVATGLMVAEAIEAGKLLEEKGIDAASSTSTPSNHWMKS